MSKPVAVVVGVGAEKELGAALWRRFAASGYHVLVATRTADKIEKVANTIVSSDGSAAPVVTEREGLVALRQGRQVRKVVTGRNAEGRAVIAGDEKINGMPIPGLGDLVVPWSADEPATYPNLGDNPAAPCVTRSEALPLGRRIHRRS